MSNLNQFFGGSLWGGPLIWVQDVKDMSVGGGHYGTTQRAWRVKDMNRIVQNSISGASLTNDGTNSAAVGTVGTQGIVNNPASGTHNALSYVTLPAGTYYCRHNGGLSVNSAGSTVFSSQCKLYNVTDGSDIGFFGIIDAQSVTALSSSSDLFFTITATKNIDVRVQFESDTAIQSGLLNLGRYDSALSGVTLNLSTIFFKLA